MRKLFNSLASGSWLTLERVRTIAAIAGLGTVALVAWLFATSNGTLDWIGRPLGTDFSNVWTAGLMALHGRAAEVWSWPAHFAVQQAVHHSKHVDLFGWHYPPPFLLIASVLATIPYVPALIAWQLVTLVPFAWMMQKIVPGRDCLLLTLAAPVTLLCLTHGQNGFLTALLLGGGLILLDRRPLVAGLLFGCLIYKPQFGLILPLLLLSGRHWRAIAGALLSAGLLVAITLAIWGWPVWQAFLDSLPLTRHVVIENGATGFHKIMSPFAAVRLWGGPIALAYAIQLAATLLAMAAVVAVSWKRAAPELRNAAVCAAVIISTPYVLDYDLVVLLPAIAWLWVDRRQRGFRPWEATMMAFAWIAPLSAREIAQHLYLPVGLISVIMVGFIALRPLMASPSRHSREAFAR